MKDRMEGETRRRSFLHSSGIAFLLGMEILLGRLGGAHLRRVQVDFLGILAQSSSVRKADQRAMLLARIGGGTDVPAVRRRAAPENRFDGVVDRSDLHRRRVL